jgi:hypothetical protein
MLLEKITRFLGLLFFVLNFLYLFIPVSNGKLKPEPTEIISGQNFEVEIPEPETEARFCFSLDGAQTVTILGNNYFEITQNNLVGYAIMDENGNSHFELVDATGCWEIKRDETLKMRFINDFSDVQFQNHSHEKEKALASWRWQFNNFFFWCLTNFLLRIFVSDIKEKISTTSKTEDDKENPELVNYCTYCNSKLTDEDNCPQCGAPQNQKQKEE